MTILMLIIFRNDTSITLSQMKIDNVLLFKRTFAFLVTGV